MLGTLLAPISPTCEMISDMRHPDPRTIALLNELLAKAIEQLAQISATYSGAERRNPLHLHCLCRASVMIGAIEAARCHRIFTTDSAFKVLFRECGATVCWLLNFTPDAGRREIDSVKRQLLREILVAWDDVAWATDDTVHPNDQLDEQTVLLLRSLSGNDPMSLAY